MRNTGYLLLATAIAILLSSNVSAQGIFFKTTGIAGPLTEFITLVILIIEAKFLFDMSAITRKKRTEEHLEYIAGGVVIIGIALVVLIFAEVLSTTNAFMLELLFETLIVTGSILITYGTYELKNYLKKH